MATSSNINLHNLTFDDTQRETSKSEFNRTLEEIEKVLEGWLKKPLILNRSESGEKM